VAFHDGSGHPTVEGADEKSTNSAPAVIEPLVG
jgi:hypothetical protein